MADGGWQIDGGWHGAGVAGVGGGSAWRQQPALAQALQFWSPPWQRPSMPLNAPPCPSAPHPLRVGDSDIVMVGLLMRDTGRSPTRLTTLQTNAADWCINIQCEGHIIRPSVCEARQQPTTRELETYKSHTPKHITSPSHSHLQTQTTAIMCMSATCPTCCKPLPHPHSSSSTPPAAFPLFIITLVNPTNTQPQPRRRGAAAAATCPPSSPMCPRTSGAPASPRSRRTARSTRRRPSRGSAPRRGCRTWLGGSR